MGSEMCIRDRCAAEEPTVTDADASALARTAFDLTRELGRGASVVVAPDPFVTAAWVARFKAEMGAVAPHVDVSVGGVPGLGARNALLPRDRLRARSTAIASLLALGACDAVVLASGETPFTRAALGVAAGTSFSSVDAARKRTFVGSRVVGLTRIVDS